MIDQEEVDRVEMQSKEDNAAMRGKSAQSKARAREREMRQEAAGIPDSPIFAEREAAPESPTLDCHVGGRLVRDMPLEFQGLISYRATDEGIAEFNEGKSERRVEVDAAREDRRWIAESNGTPGHFESLMRSTDAFGKALDQRRDDVKDRGMDSFQARDPLKEVADKYAVRGMRAKFLSANKIKDGGGTGDYEVVTYPTGHKHAGDPVKVKGMILGHIPEDLAKRRTSNNQARGNELLKQISKQYKAEGGATALTDQ